MKTTDSEQSGEVDAGQERASVRLDPNARVPLYHQIFLILRNRIFGGEVQSGELVPGEQELAVEFNVSRITASASHGSARAAFSSISFVASVWSRLPQFTPIRTALL